MNDVYQNLTLEPTAKGSVLKFDKFIYAKSMNSEQEGKPLFLGLDKAIIVRSIVLPFAYAQGVQSSLTLGRNIIVMLVIYKNSFQIVCLTEPSGEGRFLYIVYARQFYSHRPPTDPSFRSASGLPERIGSLKTCVLQSFSCL